MAKKKVTPPRKKRKYTRRVDKKIIELTEARDRHFNDALKLITLDEETKANIKSSFERPTKVPSIDQRTAKEIVDQFLNDVKPLEQHYPEMLNEIIKTFADRLTDSYSDASDIANTTAKRLDEFRAIANGGLTLAPAPKGR